MKKKYLKELHDLHHEKNFSADMLRMAIECIFRRDYWETKRIQEPQDKNEWIDQVVLDPATGKYVKTGESIRLTDDWFKREAADIVKNHINYESFFYFLYLIASSAKEITCRT